MKNIWKLFGKINMTPPFRVVYGCQKKKYLNFCGFVCNLKIIFISVKKKKKTIRLHKQNTGHLRFLFLT